MFSPPPSHSLWYRLGILPSHSILTLSPGSIRSLRLRGSVPQDHPNPPLQVPLTSPGCYLCFWSAGLQMEVPTTPSSNLNLLEQLTELRETNMLSSSLRSMNRIQWRVEMDVQTGEMYKTRCVERGVGSQPCLASPLFQHLHVSHQLHCQHVGPCHLHFPPGSSPNLTSLGFFWRLPHGDRIDH